jgi:uncharacterized protein (DUF2147 family)
MERNGEDLVRINCASAAALLLAVMAVMAGPKMIGPASAATASPLGTWYTEGNDSQVRIANCGNAICGSIVWLKEPNDPKTGKPKTDKDNANAAKRNRPLLGVEIVLGLKPSGTADQWKGQVYNPKDGNTYTGYFTMTGANSAELKGCALGFICKSQAWTRAK